MINVLFRTFSSENILDEANRWEDCQQSSGISVYGRKGSPAILRKLRISLHVVAVFDVALF